MLSIFPRISQKQLLKYCGPWKRPWSASWGKSSACGLLHYNRGTGYLSQIRYSLVVILKLNGVSEVQYKDVMMIDDGKYQ